MGTYFTWGLAKPMVALCGSGIGPSLNPFKEGLFRVAVVSR